MTSWRGWRSAGAAVGNGAADAWVDGAAKKTGTAPPPDTAERRSRSRARPVWRVTTRARRRCRHVVPAGWREEVLGCKHYARKVRLVAACCGAAHVCRFCHDESEDHTIDRYATKR